MGVTKMTKIDLKKEFKELYSASKSKASLVEVPEIELPHD